MLVLETHLILNQFGLPAKSLSTEYWALFCHFKRPRGCVCSTSSTEADRLNSERGLVACISSTEADSLNSQFDYAMSTCECSHGRLATGSPSFFGQGQVRANPSLGSANSDPSVGDGAHNHSHGGLVVFCLGGFTFPCWGAWVKRKR